MSGGERKNVVIIGAGAAGMVSISSLLSPKNALLRKLGEGLTKDLSPSHVLPL